MNDIIIYPKKGYLKIKYYYDPSKIAYSLENMKEDRVLMNEYVQKHAFSHP